MASDENETKLEKIGADLITSLAATGIAFLDGGLTAAFLPVLTSSLAAKRHQERVAKALADIQDLLGQHAEKIKKLTDAQYKLINHACISILSTVDDQKISYLKAAIVGALTCSEIESFESEILGRWIRDISADEVFFVVDKHSCLRVQLGTNTDPQCFGARSGSKEASIISGLIALGILIPPEPDMYELGTYRWSSLVPNLLALLNN